MQTTIKWTSSLQNFMNLPLSRVEQELTAALDGTLTASFIAVSEGNKGKTPARTEHPRAGQDAPRRFKFQDLVTYWEKHVRE